MKLTGDEMFAVSTRVSTHARELRSDLTDQELLLLSFSNGESSLQHVVYEDNRQESRQVVVPIGLTY